MTGWRRTLGYARARLLEALATRALRRARRLVERHAALTTRARDIFRELRGHD